MITMRGTSRLFAETLNSNLDFIALSNSLISSTFNYYVNVDLANLAGGVALPYFSIVTFNDKDDKEVSKSFQTQFLIGIAREDFTTTSNITEEPTLAKLEALARKAIDVISKEIRDFGIEGDTNIKVAYVNMYVPNPDGEDDLQMQVDIELEQEKFLCKN